MFPFAAGFVLWEFLNKCQIALPFTMYVWYSYCRNSIYIISVVFDDPLRIGKWCCVIRLLSIEMKGFLLVAPKGCESRFIIFLMHHFYHNADYVFGPYCGGSSNSEGVDASQFWGSLYIVSVRYSLPSMHTFLRLRHNKISKIKRL